LAPAPAGTTRGRTITGGHSRLRAASTSFLDSRLGGARGVLRFDGCEGLIPDDLAECFGGNLSRRALEMLTLDEYKNGHLTAAELRRLLGFRTRYQLDGFLRAQSIICSRSAGSGAKLDRESSGVAGSKAGERTLRQPGARRPWQKSSRIGNAGETACATIANQQFAAQVGPIQPAGTSNHGLLV
jgi:hypothetical protein